MLRVFTAFDALGIAEMALKELKIPHKLVGTSLPNENDELAYTKLHGKTNHLGVLHLLSVDDIPSHDLFFYRFYLKDVMQLVHKTPKSTRTLHKRNLMLSYEEIMRKKKPYMAVMEVPPLKTNRRFRLYIKRWLEILESMGYINYTSTLNSRYYGTPQSRSRLFIVSVVDPLFTYQFPDKDKIMHSFRDVLVDRCSKKYLMSKQKISELKNNRVGINPTKISQVFKIVTPTVNNPNVYRVYHPIGLAPSLNSANGGGRTPYVILNMNNVTYKKYQMPDKPIIRKITPLECSRLMTIDEKYYKKMKKLSDSEQYRLLGDTTVKNVLVEVFRNLFVKDNTMYQLFLEMEKEASENIKRKKEIKRKRRKR